jgi:hypothetical protein
VDACAIVGGSSHIIPITYEFPEDSPWAVSMTKEQIKLKCIKEILCRFCRVDIYVKKKDCPDNHTRLEQIDRELEQCQAKIKKYDKNIEQVQLAFENTKNLIEVYQTEKAKIGLI